MRGSVGFLAVQHNAVDQPRQHGRNEVAGEIRLAVACQQETHRINDSPGHHADDGAVAHAAQRDGEEAEVNFQARPQQVDRQAFQHDGHGADQPRKGQHPRVVQLAPGSAPVVSGKDGQLLFAHKKILLCALPHKGGGNFCRMGTTPHPPLHTIMQQWDAKPAPRTFPSLRPATTPRWSGTPGPSPTRRSLLCENNFNYTWILGKCKRKLFVKGNGRYPSGLVNSASSPDGAPFCAGCAREKASPSGEVAARQQGRKGSARLP